jgi:hypothetical protein
MMEGMKDRRKEGGDGWVDGAQTYQTILTAVDKR